MVGSPSSIGPPAPCSRSPASSSTAGSGSKLMQARRISGWVAGLWAALASACGGQDKRVEVAVGRPMDVTSITDHAVFIDHARGEAVLLDVSQKSPPPGPSIVPLVASPTLFEARKGHPDQL